MLIGIYAISKKELAEDTPLSKHLFNASHFESYGKGGLWEISPQPSGVATNTPAFCLHLLNILAPYICAKSSEAILRVDVNLHCRNL